MPDYKSLFPKSFKARDFRNAPQVLTIKSVEPRVLTGKDETVSTKLCIRFEETNRFWLAGPREACPSIAEAVGSSDVDEWIGATIELYEDETDFGDDRVDCVRARRPAGGQRSKRTPRAGASDEDYPKLLGYTGDGLLEIQLREGGRIFEIPEDDLEGVVSGEIVLDDPDQEPEAEPEPEDDLAAMKRKLSDIKSRRGAA